MSAKKSSVKHLRTWIEINAHAVQKNVSLFRKLIGKKVKLWSVVKSNAYGHGLYAFSKLADRAGVDGFCVDSIVEGTALRREGVKKPILVLGVTLPTRYAEAEQNNVTVTVSNFDALRSLARAKKIPEFHMKIDTGMHRQGFSLEEIPRVIAFLKSRAGQKAAQQLKGIYTHFASAKDINYRGYTEMQFKKFENAVALFTKAGFKKLLKHVAATGGTLVDKKYHCDAVRVGIGLYGLWPSKELEVQLGGTTALHPALSWRALVGEVKKLKAGDYVGYDLTERVPRACLMAVLPVGYWQGFSRALSGQGEALIRGARCRTLGRVSMDMSVFALPPSSRAKSGDIATLIGRAGGEEIFAWEPAGKSGTTHYEFLTRLNPLIERVVT